MSDGANKAFRNDPQGFLRSNAILLKEGGMPSVAGCYKVNLRAAVHETVKDSDGTPLGVYIPYLAQVDPTRRAADTLELGDVTVTRMVLPGASKSKSSNQFKAFYIPWGPNATHVVDLDNQAGFLFTPGLTGCSFAATNGRAGHFNYQKDGTDKVSTKATRAAVRREFGGQRGISTKRADYIQADGEVQRYLYIVGWREGIRWRFFRQHFEYAGAGFGLSLKRLAMPSEIDNVHRFGSV